MKIVEWVVVTAVFAAALAFLEGRLPGGWRAIGRIAPGLESDLAKRLPSVGPWQAIAWTGRNPP